VASLLALCANQLALNVVVSGLRLSISLTSTAQPPLVLDSSWTVSWRGHVKINIYESRAVKPNYAIRLKRDRKSQSAEVTKATDLAS
jgi:hypothetical protein